MDRFTICIGNDRKTVLFQPNKSLSSVVEKFCVPRNLNPYDFVIFDDDNDGNVVGGESLLGEIDGNIVYLKKKDELFNEQFEIDLSTPSTSPRLSTSLPTSTNPSSTSTITTTVGPPFSTGSLSSTSSLPFPLPSSTTELDQLIKNLQRQIHEKDKEINSLRVQFNSLTKTWENINKKIKQKEMKKRSEDGATATASTTITTTTGSGNSAEELDNITSSERRKSLSKPWKRNSASDFEAQITEAQKLNESLKNKLSEANLEKKPYIMDCFTDQEITYLLENEIVSRILVGRDISMSPQGIHPDVLTLTEFIKKGRYLEKADNNSFLNAVFKMFLKVYKSSGKTLNRLVFWMSQLVYVCDWLSFEQKSGNKISIYGIDLTSLNPKIDSISSGVPNFYAALYQLVCKIFHKLQKSAYESLKPLCIKVAHNHNVTATAVTPSTSVSTATAAAATAAPPAQRSISSASAPASTTAPSAHPSMATPTLSPDEAISATLAEMLKLLNKFQHTFLKFVTSDVVVLQFFHQVYHYMDRVVFNEILKFHHYLGQTGVDLKLVVSQLDCWKYTHLKKFYLDDNTINLYLPFQELAVMPLLTEATILLVIDKNNIKDEAFVKAQFPSLTPNQIYVLLSRFVADEYAPGKVPSEILEKYKAGAVGHQDWTVDDKKIFSFLLSKK